MIERLVYLILILACVTEVAGAWMHDSGIGVLGGLVGAALATAFLIGTHEHNTKEQAR